MPMETMLGKWDAIRPHCVAVELSNGMTMEFVFEDDVPGWVLEKARELLLENARENGGDYRPVLSVVGDDVPLRDHRSLGEEPEEPDWDQPATIYTAETGEPRTKGNA